MRRRKFLTTAGIGGAASTLAASKNAGELTYENFAFTARQTVM